MAKQRSAPKMTPGRAALVGLIDRYLSGLLDPFVTLLEVHKLMYFMKVSGEPVYGNASSGEGSLWSLRRKPDPRISRA